MSNNCPECSSRAFKRNGYTRHGKQNHRCLDCGRQFSLEPVDFEDHHRQIELIVNPLNEAYKLEHFC